MSSGVHEALTVQHRQKLIVGAHVRHSTITTEDLSIVVVEDLNPVAAGVSAVISAVKLVVNLGGKRKVGEVSVVGIKEEEVFVIATGARTACGYERRRLAASSHS